MTILTVTSKGQVTLRKDLLRHLGVEPGDRIEVKAVRPAGTIDDFIGLLAGKTDKVATIEEMNEAAASAWAGQG